MVRQASERARAPGPALQRPLALGTTAQGPALIPVRRNNCSWFPRGVYSIFLFHFFSLFIMFVFIKINCFLERVVCILITSFTQKMILAMCVVAVGGVVEYIYVGSFP